MGDPKSDAPSTSAPKKPLSPAAERALAKAAEAHAVLEHSKDVVGRIVLHPWDDV